MSNCAWLPIMAAGATGLLILAACSEPQHRPGIGTATLPDHRSEPHYKIGLPYEINGIRYHPAVDYRYTETGIASWYGSKFHGRPTANGEIFDMNTVSAAHRTLPMPSIVRVTNLENRRSITARVNDRGPFAKNRIIDMSRRAAQLLGFRSKGLARVRVQILPKESLRVAAIARGEIAAQPKLSTRVPRDNGSAVVRDPRPVRVAFIDTSPLPKALPRNRHKPLKRPIIRSAALADTNEKAKRFYVQAGAFRNYENAVRLQSRLASMGKVAIVPASREIPVYRVRIGPYADAADAKGLLRVIVAKGQPEARVIFD